MLISYENDSNSLDNLIDAIFPDLNSPSKDILRMLNRTILTPKNGFVDEINIILSKDFLVNLDNTTALMRQ